MTEVIIIFLAGFLVGVPTGIGIELYNILRRQKCLANEKKVEP